jgi:two-component system sensor histidine kinase/response regulator
MTRVLIVDDEPSIRQLIATLLTLEGFEVTTAPDGQAALEQVQANPPDLVVSDVRMPFMNGYELLAAVRANPALAKIHFILLTSFTDDDLATKKVMAMADACLTKPFTRNLLLDTIRMLAT